MAANPLLACDPATSWYNFTYPLSWSNECEVAQLLSDIPSISVGILLLGVSVLFLIIKRVSLSTVWLFSSSLLAFIAAVLDLGQTLAGGMVMSTINQPVIRTREALFALSIGFRFLFYWSYVAEPPRKHLSVASTKRDQKNNFLTLEYTREPHSGSWMRWGLPGRLLGVGLLVAIITITALQIVWREVPQSHQYSSVYATDAALELLVSFLLLLKLLSNTLILNSPDSMLVHTVKECLAPISGLLVNIAIGVGDLLSFAFTESTVGRLLQAFEVYIVVVFVVVTAFLSHRNILLSTTSSQGRKRRDVVFTLPEPARGSTFRITPPLIETPRMSTILGAATQNMQSSREVLRRSARRSLNHVSSWLSSRVSKNRSHLEDEEVKLWNSGKVKVDPPYTGNIDTELRASFVSSAQEPKEWTEPVRDASTNHISIISALDAQSALARSMEGSTNSGQVLHPSQTDVPLRTVPPRETSSGPLSSAPPLMSSGTKHAGTITTPSEAPPLYGRGSPRSLASDPDSQMSLDELLRQQSQLDKSIEALRLFSKRTSANSSRSNSVLGPTNVELTRSPSTGQRTVSSDVSLSNFPIPPWLTTPIPSLPSSRPSSIKRIRGDRRVRLAATRPTSVQDTDASVHLETLASQVDIPSSPRFNSIPHSPFGEDTETLPAGGRFSRSDSGGTQYNVTSFIGGLATPGHPRLGNQENPRWPVETETSVGAIQTSSGTKLPPVARPHEVLSVLSPVTKHSPPPPVTGRAEKSTPIPPTRPELARARGLHLTTSTEGADRSQRMFVRPRPPPLAILSHTEQDPRIPRVQVLADD